MRMLFVVVLLLFVVIVVCVVECDFIVWLFVLCSVLVVVVVVLVVFSVELVGIVICQVVFVSGYVYVVQCGCCYGVGEQFDGVCIECIIEQVVWLCEVGQLCCELFYVGVEKCWLVLVVKYFKEKL